MTTRRHSRAPFFFVLFTAFLDFILAMFTNQYPVNGTMLLTTSIVGLSIAQMAFCLILLMRNLSAWKLLIPGLFAAIFFGITVTHHPQGAELDRVLAIQLITVAFGIIPVAIYRVVFVGLKVQFSLSLLFGAMTVVTVLCGIAIQLDFDWDWFLTFIYLFLCSAIPIPIAGFMLVRRRPAAMGQYIPIMSLLVVISMIVALSRRSLIDDVSLVGQLCGFMSLYFLAAGVILLREIKAEASSVQAESTEPIDDLIAPD